MIKHKHFQTLDSTQIYLLENSSLHDTNVLISTENQTNGIGQYKRNWMSFQNSLAMSFTLLPSKVPSLTSLEVGILTKRYIQKKFQTELLLKWPNDLYDQKKQKCGGILINGISKKFLIVGIGLNLVESQSHDQFTNPHGFILKDKQKLETQELAKNLYQYILNHRLSPTQIKEEWLDYCIHKDKEVLIQENAQEYSGIFMGIGEYGQAKIKVAKEIKEVFSASLRLK